MSSLVCLTPTSPRPLFPDSPRFAPAQPGPSRSRRVRPASPRPANWMSGFWIRHFGSPDMPCMKRFYKNKQASVHFSSSQERRALAVPLTNRSSTARCVPRSGLHRISFVRASGGSSKLGASNALEGKMDGFFLGASSRRFWAHQPAAIPPRPAAPRRAPSRTAPTARLAAVRRPASSRPWYGRVLDPTVVCPGFGSDRFVV